MQADMICAFDNRNPNMRSSRDSAPMSVSITIQKDKINIEYHVRMKVHEMRGILDKVLSCYHQKKGRHSRRYKCHRRQGQGGGGGRLETGEES